MVDPSQMAGPSPSPGPQAPTPAGPDPSALLAMMQLGRHGLKGKKRTRAIGAKHKAKKKGAK